MENFICLNSVGERTQKCDRENWGWRWRQIKSIYRWYLDLVVVSVSVVIVEMLGLLIVPLSEIKSYIVVLSFHIKVMKRRILQVWSLKQTYLSWVEGRVLNLFPHAHPLPPSPRYAPVKLTSFNWNFGKIQFLYKLKTTLLRMYQQIRSIKKYKI